MYDLILQIVKAWVLSILVLCTEQTLFHNFWQTIKEPDLLKDLFKMWMIPLVLHPCLTLRTIYPDVMITVLILFCFLEKNNIWKLPYFGSTNNLLKTEKNIVRAYLLCFFVCCGFIIVFNWYWCFAYYCIFWPGKHCLSLVLFQNRSVTYF